MSASGATSPTGDFMKPIPVKTLKVVHVYLRSWWRGQGCGRSKLVRSQDNKKCCLGFFCLQAGVPRRELVNVPTPQSLPTRVPQLTRPDVGGYTNTRRCQAMMGVNDDEDITDHQRMARLRKLFRAIGVRAIFSKK